MRLSPLQTTQERSPRISDCIQIAFRTAFFVVIGSLGFACSSPTAPEPEGISNPQIDLTIGTLGDNWLVENNQGNTLDLRTSDLERQGSVRFVVGAEETGVNLVAAIDAHRQTIESLPDGVYSGARELTGPMGTAFYSRGRFNNDGITTEETRIFSIHPRSNRLLELVYRYPAREDSSTRVSELIELFSEVE